MRFGLSATFVAAAIASYAAQPGKTGTLHLTCNLGSFKLYNGSGTITMHFKGTILVVGYQGTPLKLSGTVKKEYDARGRQAYFGEGDAVLTGHFEDIQWFGQNMKLTWVGAGGFQLYGDYDKNLETGWFWYDDDVAHRTAWGTGGANGAQILPKYNPNAAAKQPVLKGK